MCYTSVQITFSIINKHLQLFLQNSVGGARSGVQGASYQSDDIQPSLKPVGQKTAVPFKPFKLSETAECMSDIQKYCKRSSSNNFAVMDCLQNDLKVCSD